MQALETALDGIADPFRRVVEFRRGEASDFCEKDVRGTEMSRGD